VGIIVIKRDLLSILMSVELFVLGIIIGILLVSDCFDDPNGKIFCLEYDPNHLENIIKGGFSFLEEKENTIFYVFNESDGFLWRVDLKLDPRYIPLYEVYKEVINKILNFFGYERGNSF